MKIKRLEIVGFKSFVERTVFSFDAGISAILGPNGCGKSNVVDAVRWVMGEQSATNLRGQSMGDVIFAGSDARRAHGMAEVNLIFDNSGTLEHPPVTHPLVKEYAEIMVTRRLYRNGESEYLLNKTPCRLKDITELFLDTGVGARAYSIIEQGKVATVLQARPEERRVLIEEAAGISKYKARRKTALRKIEGAQHNLQRVDDIISEVGERLTGLERQAREAREFRELRQQMRDLDIGLGIKRLRELQQRHTLLQQTQEECQARVQQGETDLHQCGLELERCRIARDESDALLAQQKKQLFAWRSDLQECENASALARQQQENHTRHQKEISAEIGQIETQLREERQHLTELQQQRDARERKVRQMEHAVEQEHRELDAAASEEQRLRRELDQAKAVLRKAQESGERLSKKTGDMEREQAVLQERQAVFSQERSRSAEALRSAQAEEKAGIENLTECTDQVKSAQGEVRQLYNEMLEKKSTFESVQQGSAKVRHEYQQSKSRLESLHELVESRADVETPVLEVLQDAVLGAGFDGILADALKVEPAYETAVAAALGERLEALCFAPGADVTGMLAALRAHPGRHICQIEVPVQEHEWSAGVALTQELEIPHALNGVLNGVYVVDEIVSFVGQPLPPGVILVTLSGEMLTWQGKMALGQKVGGNTTLLQNRRRIEELERQTDVLREEVRAEDAKLESARDLYAKAEAAHNEKQLENERLNLHKREAEHILDRARQQRSALERELEKHEKQLHQSGQRLDSIQEQLAQLQHQEQNHVQDVDKAAERVTKIEQEWEQTRTDVQQKQQHHAEERSASAVASEQFKSLCNDIKHVKRDIERQTERLEGLRQRRGELVAELEMLEQRDKELGGRMDVLLQKLRASKESVARAQQTLDRRNEDLSHAEQREREQRTLLYQARQKLDSTTLEFEHNGQDVTRQQQWLEQTYAISPDEYAAGHEALPEDAHARLKRLQRRIENFGEVNLLAVEEFDALNERHGFLLEQQQDLLQSIADLRKAIAQINRKSRNRFKKTFAQVNEQFMYVFPRLFSGGNARLVLTDPEDMLTTGVDIEARPPGKKLQNINLLSGGEKALTAVALIFAIFQIKPSPFCILDEVDAPLDHANIGRFNAMVKEMAAASQFVIITHNTRTMEIADTLYGVTMEEPGVSRLVSVDMSTYAETDRAEANVNGAG